MRESFLLNLSDLEKMTIQINQGGREKIKPQIPSIDTRPSEQG
jgi:hypothetical protein